MRVAAAVVVAHGSENNRLEMAFGGSERGGDTQFLQLIFEKFRIVCWHLRQELEQLLIIVAVFEHMPLCKPAEMPLFGRIHAMDQVKYIVLDHLLHCSDF